MNSQSHSKPSDPPLTVANGKATEIKEKRVLMMVVKIIVALAVILGIAVLIGVVIFTIGIAHAFP